MTLSKFDIYDMFVLRAVAKFGSPYRVEYQKNTTMFVKFHIHQHFIILTGQSLVYTKWSNIPYVFNVSDN